MFVILFPTFSGCTLFHHVLTEQQFCIIIFYREMRDFHLYSNMTDHNLVFMINSLKQWLINFLLKSQMAETLVFVGQQTKLTILLYRCLYIHLKCNHVKCKNHSQLVGNNTKRGAGPHLIHGSNHSKPAPGLEIFLLTLQLLICNIHINLEIVVNFGKSTFLQGSYIIY